MIFKLDKNDSIDQKLKVIDNINLEIAKNQGIADLEININTKRTLQQNKALHEYFKLISDEFNEKGLEFQKVFTKPQNLIITPYVVKEFMWRPIQKTIFGKDSTIELKKQEEIEKVYDVINKMLSERFGIYIPFPNKEELKNERIRKRK